MPVKLAKTIFIADLHLDESRPEITQLFINYLNKLNRQPVDALYILGDLFEYWVGDDNQTTLTNEVAKALLTLKNQGIATYFIHGNRDFLLKQQYANLCGMLILGEYELINLYGNKTLIMHGDTLCTDDVDYMTFRQKVRTEKWQKTILRLPLFIRKYKAKKMRKQSKKANDNKTSRIMDVNQLTVEKVMTEAKVTQLIHGHTHRPNIHHFKLGEVPATRYVVGDWYNQGSALEVSQAGISLVKLAI